jgi:hypothetical protein
MKSPLPQVKITFFELFYIYNTLCGIKKEGAHIIFMGFCFKMLISKEIKEDAHLSSIKGKSSWTTRY